VPLLDSLADAPNPKPTQWDKRQFGALASLYTAFSKEFASYALQLFQSQGLRVVADPFAGMGTVGEAGRPLAIELHLSDISPFAALSSAFRSARQSDIFAAATLIEELAPEIVADDERVFFEHLFNAVGTGSPNATELTLNAPTEPEHRQSALAIYLAALSRIRLHKRFAGSNPTWVKRPNQNADGDATRRALTETLNAARSYANNLECLHPDNRTVVRSSSVQDMPTEPNSLDAIVTSPPYANRTDYIRHYLPASEILLAASGRSEREVRLEQIGTPLIRTDSRSVAMPASVQNTLDRIRNHGSYASERYYYKGFLYYFVDMRKALRRLHEWLRPGGLLLMVVQDTFYKELHVATPDLLSDLAEAEGLLVAGRKDWNVRQSLSQLSPHSRKTARPGKLSEAVIAFSK
jgi:hypothetical protein